MNMDGFRIFEVQERNPLNIQIYFERNENYEKASSIFSCLLYTSDAADE